MASHGEPPEHLIGMINQIAANTQHRDNLEAAAVEVANHVHKFWARSMKKQIMRYRESNGDALSDTARRAVELLPEPR